MNRINKINKINELADIIINMEIRLNEINNKLESSSFFNTKSLEEELKDSKKDIIEEKNNLNKLLTKLLI
tara:strand:+ start:1584 stop:1793 length:210 start_codon:yes stop_codon:yes gene_type:complete